MSYIRAGGITTLLISILATAALVWFGELYAGYSSGEAVHRVLLWFPISLIGVTPVCLILFPLIHLVIGQHGTPLGKVFAAIGGVCGAAISGYCVFRFRAIMFPNTGISFIAVPLMVLSATALGMVAGFLFERLARRKPTEPRVIEGEASAVNETSA
ncbi:MAG: hypothetical protein LCH61_08745 [Proteobacteria bacterium]|nr:hypothetical protein [Pseudomonadota bacterium]